MTVWVAQVNALVIFWRHFFDFIVLWLVNDPSYNRPLYALCKYHDVCISCNNVCTPDYGDFILTKFINAKMQLTLIVWITVCMVPTHLPYLKTFLWLLSFLLLVDWSWPGTIFLVFPGGYKRYGGNYSYTVTNRLLSRLYWVNQFNTTIIAYCILAVTYTHQMLAMVIS